MKIARVFPSETNMSPCDSDAYYDVPTIFVPKYNKVMVSVTFTWDIEKGKELKKQWETVCDDVQIGGPAFGDPGYNFKPGVFLKPECIFTSKGCPNKCPWCFVPKREGKLVELPIYEGNIICDNNFTATSRQHQEKVFKMLKSQREISFNQGLESCRITDWFVEQLRGLRIKEIFLAMDYDSADKSLEKAMRKIRKYFPKKQIKCYVLVGYKNDTIKKAEKRLLRAWELGVYPLAMLYRGENDKRHDKKWKDFVRIWFRPAGYKTKYNLKEVY